LDWIDLRETSIGKQNQGVGSNSMEKSGLSENTWVFGKRMYFRVKSDAMCQETRGDPVFPHPFLHGSVVIHFRRLQKNATRFCKHEGI
jgi:hypothetical protein